MEKTTTLNIRVNPSVKKNAEDVLDKLGISMSTAIDMYLNQIYLTQSIPFTLKLPQAPGSVNIGVMSKDELMDKINHGYDDIAAGNVHDAAASFARFKEQHSA